MIGRRRLVAVIASVLGVIGLAVAHGLSLLGAVSDLFGAVEFAKSLKQQADRMPAPLAYEAILYLGIMGGLAYLVWDIWGRRFWGELEQSPLVFKHHADEHPMFGGHPGAVEFPVVIENTSSVSVNDANVRLISLRQIHAPGQKGGSPAFHNLPHRLSSFEGELTVSVAPGCEAGFRLLKRVWYDDDTAQAFLLPGTVHEANMRIPMGAYIFFVKASGRDVPPRNARYFVEVRQDGGSYKLCGDDDKEEALLMSRVNVQASVRVMADGQND